jgi:hypothetical protein
VNGYLRDRRKFHHDQRKFESINLGDVKEATANKSIDGTFASNSDIKFPTEKATKTYVDGGEATLNKTLTAISNTIAAKQLLSATAAIDIYASCADSTVLTATSGSAAAAGQASGTTTGDMQYWNGTGG